MIVVGALFFVAVLRITLQRTQTARTKKNQESREKNEGLGDYQTDTQHTT